MSRPDIKLRFKKEIYYNHLNVGDTFIYSGILFIKTDTVPVNLINGSHYELYDDTKVSPVDVIITEKQE